MKPLTISRKLILLVSVSILSLALTWLLSNVEIREAQDRFDTVQKDIIPSIQVLNKANSDSAALRSAVRDVIIGGFIEDTNLESNQKKKIEELKSSINESLSLYAQQYASTREDKDLLEEDKKALAAYLKEVDDLFLKVEANDTAGIAQHFSDTGMFRKTAVALIGQFNLHAKYNQEKTDALREEGDTKYKAGLFWIMTQGSLCLILLVVWSYLVIKGIRSSLSKLTKSIKKIEGEMDFTTIIEDVAKDEIGEVADSLNRLTAKLRGSFKSIIEGSRKILEASEQLSLASGQVASSSSLQSDSASSMAASMEELTVSISHVSDKTFDTHTFAVQSGEFSKEGSKTIASSVQDMNSIAEVVHEVSLEMDELNARGEKISTVVSVIREVAEQTNLLALNAAIEAARAGDTGRGFAVVADEVRKLAERTACSTKEINEMMTAIKTHTATAVKGMVKVNEFVATGLKDSEASLDVIKCIEESSDKIVQMTEEVSSSMKEQGEASNLLASNIEHIAQVTEENSAVAKNTAELATRLDALSHEMQSIVKQYHI